jgi:hypothetical protein
MGVQPDQQRITQLTSAYSPSNPPRLALTFGDFLSLLWRVDASAGEPRKEAYYRLCVDAIARGLQFDSRRMYRMLQITPAGQVCATLQNAPYRGTSRLIDAQDRREAIRQLVDLRGQILTMAAYRDRWTLGWPGSRLTDVELRERLFAVFFTAFDSQFANFSRMLFVIDIVLQEILLGDREDLKISLIKLIKEYDYPDPDEHPLSSQFDV